MNQVPNLFNFDALSIFILFSFSEIDDKDLPLENFFVHMYIFK